MAEQVIAMVVPLVPATLVVWRHASAWRPW
jgi:hypothetical protein